jgi:hypothetical protein
MGRKPGALTLSEDDRRVLAVWAADCAERTLSLSRRRPRMTHARGMPSTASEPSLAARCGSGRSAPLSAQAHAAARKVGDPAAVAAARATGHAAAVAHARGVGLAAPHDPTAVAEEVRWQLRHASPTVRDVLRTLPPPTRSAGMLGS